MTGQQINRDRLRELAENATPGPWVRNGRNGIHTPIGSCIALTHRHDDDERKADADFIAAARTAVPALLDQLDQAEAERDKYIHLIGVLAEQVAAREANQEQVRAALDRVRALHQPCTHDAHCAECGQHMPCDTIRALDGEQ